MLLEEVIEVLPPDVVQEQAMLLGLAPNVPIDIVLEELDSRYTAPLHPDFLRNFTQAISDLAQDASLSFEDLEQLPLPLLVAEAYEFGVNIQGSLDRDYILDLLYVAILENPIPNVVQSWLFEVEDNLEFDSYLGEY